MNSQPVSRPYFRLGLLKCYCSLLGISTGVCSAGSVFLLSVSATGKGFMYVSNSHRAYTTNISFIKEQIQKQSLAFK